MRRRAKFLILIRHCQIFSSVLRSYLEFILEKEFCTNFFESPVVAFVSCVLHRGVVLFYFSFNNSFSTFCFFLVHFLPANLHTYLRPTTTIFFFFFFRHYVPTTSYAFFFVPLSLCPRFIVLCSRAPSTRLPTTTILRKSVSGTIKH